MKRYLYICLCTFLYMSLYCGQVCAEKALDDRSGKCTITSNGHTDSLSGCLIKMGKEEDLTWYIIEKKDGKPLLEELRSVSIVEMSPGTAEIKGLTQHGINSLWGQAKRDGDCWSGEDFRICIQ